ncbi:hypothetical protein ACHAPO_005215 [Fusarium lateritium]
MPQHITVLPASTKAGRETIRVLLASDSKTSVRGVYRDPSKAPPEFTKNSNFEAVKGDVGDGNSLDFTGSNAVFYIPPPTYDGTNQGEWATRAATNVKKALKDANVNRLVILSAIGAHNSSGIVGLKDVASNVANSLLASTAKPSPHYFNLFGPRAYGSVDLKDAVEEITGKKVELKLVEEDQLLDYWKQIVPEAYAEEFKEMTTAGFSGGVIAKDFIYDEKTIRGEQELVDALRSLYKN